MEQATLVDRLVQTKTQLTMHLDRRINNLFPDFLDFHNFAILATLAVKKIQL